LATPIIIGISFSETKYPNYPAWILGETIDVEIVELSWEKQNMEDLAKCHGLLLSGGVDMDPKFIQPAITQYPNQPAEWSAARDQFELDLFSAAQRLRMPILGVCRGLQLVNVALGGNLLTDLEDEGKPNHRSRAGVDHVHGVQLLAGSLLETITAIHEGEVNSAHHQAINRVADSLMVNCISQADEIIEGIEWKEKENRSPMICVQWHPERIINKEQYPLSKNIRDWFLAEAAKYSA
jgi:putative glutamine amidotransferase